jgi:hypothetical protein
LMLGSLYPFVRLSLGSGRVRLTLRPDALLR